MKTAVCTIFIATVLSSALCAGPLADAPFRVAVPNPDWVFSDSAALAEEGSHIVAVLRNKQADVLSLVSKEPAKGRTLDDLLADLEKVVRSQGEIITAERGIVFLGLKAKQIEAEDRAVERLPGGSKALSSYYIATTFIVDDTVWRISSSGPLDQKEKCKQLLEAYQSK